MIKILALLFCTALTFSRDYKLSVITQNLEGLFRKVRSANFLNQVMYFAQFVQENLLGTDNDLVLINAQESYEVTSEGIFKQLFTPDSIFYKQISSFVSDINDHIAAHNLRCYFDPNFSVAALLQIYCAKKDISFVQVFPLEQVKFSERGGIYLPFSIAGFKGGICSIFELEELSILNVDVHISSKNLDDRRSQISKILSECFEQINEFPNQKNKSQILEKPIFLVIAGDLNSRTGSNITMIDKLKNFGLSKLQ